MADDSSTPTPLLTSCKSCDSHMIVYSRGIPNLIPELQQKTRVGEGFGCYGNECL